MKLHKYDSAKRVLDVTVAAILLVATAPIQLIVATLVAINLGRPVLFRQARPGLDGKPFTLLKFRSMRDINEATGHVTNEERLTSFGRRLRSTSLDELPSLLNVMKGDMSLVGPRPLLIKYLPMYTSEQARRHAVRPGLTGLAQVNGRNSLPWEERFALDVQYIDNRSLTLDIRILARTVAKVLRRDGISSDGHAAGSPFKGSAPKDGDL